MFSGGGIVNRTFRAVLLALFLAAIGLVHEGRNNISLYSVMSNPQIST